jgi:hypothetical protein
MSLINDALKRAKEAQQSAPRENPGLQFHPVEPENPPSTSSKGSLGVLLPVALAVMGLLLVLLVWQRIKDHRNQVPREIPVRAVNPRPALAESAPSQAQDTAPAARPAVPAPLLATPTTPASVQTSKSSGTSNAPTVASDLTSGEPAATNGVALVPAPALPKPAPPKLQGVVWNPSRPSALINGQALFIGERISDYKLIRITPASATLSGSGQTIVLTLP